MTINRQSNALLRYSGSQNTKRDQNDCLIRDLCIFLSELSVASPVHISPNIILQPTYCNVATVVVSRDTCSQTRKINLFSNAAGLCRVKLFAIKWKVMNNSFVQLQCAKYADPER